MKTLFIAVLLVIATPLVCLAESYISFNINNSNARGSISMRYNDYRSVHIRTVHDTVRYTVQHNVHNRGHQRRHIYRQEGRTYYVNDHGRNVIVVPSSRRNHNMYNNRRRF